MNGIHRDKFVIVLLIMAAFVAGAIFGSRENAIAQQSPYPHLNEIEQSFAMLYDAVSPSVVSITVDRVSGGGDFFRLGSGSGFVIDTTGHIVTNYHVIEDGERIVVNFIDGTITRAEVVGTDPDADLAVIKVELPSDRLLPAVFGSSDDLIVGQTALAIGSPFGQQWTLTSGIISALDRRIEGLAQFDVGAVIQTDTAINPGNSGGPLLNLRGEVIGVNTQILSQQRANSGVGFALPSKLVQRVANEIIENGAVRYSYLGISGRDVSLEDIERRNLPDNLRGVVLTRVFPGEAADRGGLRENQDIITSIDGNPIRSIDTLIGYLATNTLPGDQIVMTVYRRGELVDVDVTLSARP